MPPEALGETLETSSFENYKKADMYSIALVIWEILSRTLLRGMVNEDLCPYKYFPLFTTLFYFHF